MSKGLTAGSAFKLAFISSATTIATFQILYSLIALFLGTESTITFNGESLSGFRGFIFSMLSLPFLVGIFGGFISVIVVIGQWLYTLVRPLTLELKDQDERD